METFRKQVAKLKHLFEGVLALLWFRFPSKRLFVIGITGTDGKTTTSSLIYHFLANEGRKVALISTVGAFKGGQKKDTGLHVTTPGPWFIQKFLYVSANQGYEYVVLEATSHGLEQHRLFGIKFDVSVLTNLTHEHLDYHKTMLNYAKAKAKLFVNSKVGFINPSATSKIDFASLVGEKCVVKRYDLLRLLEYPTSLRKTIKHRFPEMYNQLNCIAATEVCMHLGVSVSGLIKAINSFAGVPGRLEKIDNSLGIHLYIDFAHTPNSLNEVLRYLSKIKKPFKKLILVFGSAGERDKEKRPLMGKIASKYADIIILTSEDPRNESPSDIIEMIKKGINKREMLNKNLIEEPSRELAIQKAVCIAKKGDTLILCGKGHEKSLNIGGIEYPWDEKKVLLKALRAKTKS